MSNKSATLSPSVEELTKLLDVTQEWEKQSARISELRDKACHTTRTWAFDMFREWSKKCEEHPNSPSSRVLRLDGRKNDGKSTAAVVLAREIEDEFDGDVMVFSGKPKRGNEAILVCKILLAQLLAGQKEPYRKLSEKGGIDLTSLGSEVRELFKEGIIFRQPRSTYFVIDGLERCPQDNTTPIFDWFKELLSDEHLSGAYLILTNNPNHKPHSILEGTAGIRLSRLEERADFQCLVKDEMTKLKDKIQRSGGDKSLVERLEHHCHWKMIDSRACVIDEEDPWDGIQKFFKYLREELYPQGIASLLDEEEGKVVVKDLQKEDLSRRFDEQGRTVDEMIKERKRRWAIRKDKYTSKGDRAAFWQELKEVSDESERNAEFEEQISEDEISEEEEEEEDRSRKSEEEMPEDADPETRDITLAIRTTGLNGGSSAMELD